MSGKNAKHGQPKAPAEPQRAEWTVRTPGGEVHVPVSVLHLSLDGARQFRDEAKREAGIRPHGVEGSVRHELVDVPSRDAYERLCGANGCKPAPDALLLTMAREGHLGEDSFPADAWRATFSNGGVGRSRRVRWVLDRSYWVGCLERQCRSGA
mgnify:CR=1 FL=1